MQKANMVAGLLALSFLTACGSDAALLPRTGHADIDSDVPADLLADYTLVHLADNAYVVDVNDGGDAVGLTAGGAVLWTGSEHAVTNIPIDPTAIANDRTIVGSVNGHAAMWRSGRITILDTAASEANAICRCASQTVVGSVVVNGVQHAAIWAGGVRIDAGMPEGATDAAFSGIANGYIVGNATTPTLNPGSGSIDPAEQAYTWSHSSGWHQLGSIGTLVSEVVDVNSAGTSAGFEQRILNPDPTGATWNANGVRTPFFGSSPYIRSILPSAISESGQIAANSSDQGNGSLPLVGDAVLPPGKYGDVTTSINASNIIGGQSSGNAVLWIPNHP